MIPPEWREWADAGCISHTGLIIIFIQINNTKQNVYKKLQRRADWKKNPPDPFQQWQPTVSFLFMFIIKLLHCVMMNLMFYIIIYNVQCAVTLLDVRVHLSLSLCLSLWEVSFWTQLIFCLSKSILTLLYVASRYAKQNARFWLAGRRAFGPFDHNVNDGSVLMLVMSSSGCHILPKRI